MVIVPVGLVWISVGPLISDLLTQIIELPLTIEYLALILLDDHVIAFSLRRFAVIVIDHSDCEPNWYADRSSEERAHGHVAVGDQGADNRAGTSSRCRSTNRADDKRLGVERAAC